MKKLLVIFLSIFTLCATPALSNDTYIGQNCEYSILQDANGAISGTIQRDSGGLFCKIQCRDGFTATETPQNKHKKYNLDINTTLTLKHTCKNNFTGSNQQQQVARQQSTETITLSVTVLDSKTNAPLIGANVYAVNKDGNKINRTNGVIGASTDADGNATITDFPANEQVEISYIGYKTQRLYPPHPIITVSLVKDDNTLGEITITVPAIIGKPCDNKAIQYANATSGTIQKDAKNNLYCAIQCPKGRTTSRLDAEITYSFDQDTTYSLTQECVCNTGTIEINGECKSTNNCATDKNATNSNYVSTQDGNYKCEIATCADGWKPADDKQSCVEKLTECTPEQKEQHPNASATGIKPGTEVCIATACKCGFDLKDNKCVEWRKDNTTSEYSKPCADLPKNAKSGTMQCNNGAAYCKISACNDGYNHNTDNNTCDDLNKQPCTPTDKNATSAEYRRVNDKTVCFITACSSKFNPSKDGTKCVGKNILSEADSLEKINKLQKNADEMRKIEQSTENKALGALGIGATGIGGQMLASALSEQSADTDAETAMRAYLATFHCNYGAGKNIPGGEKNIELPGGNELISLYSEYVNLANDLKVRKNALGLRPGIESEPILDSATSGLYDDVSIGKTSGAYASLARALSDPNSADAAAWVAQKSDTADKLKTGAITAGIGALGSLAGNLIINRNNPDENSRQIIAEYEPLHKLYTDISEQPIPESVCPSKHPGTWPNCQCSGNNQYFNANTLECDTCPGDKTYNKNDQKCKCPDGTNEMENNKCKKPSSESKNQCNLTGDNITHNENGTCQCKSGFTQSGNTCTCNNGTVDDAGNCVIIIDQTTTITQQTSTISNTITLNNAQLFELGKFELTEVAKKALDEFIQGIKNNNYKNCTINITGYTDPVGSELSNKTLSENRANAVKAYIESDNSIKDTIKTITATGYGEINCSCLIKAPDDANWDSEDYKNCKDKAGTSTSIHGNMKYAPCRRVEISMSCEQTTTSTTSDSSTSTEVKKN